MNHKGLNQLVCAAMINARFRETLLHDPARAIKSGYLGQKFVLTQEECVMLTNIHAQKLEDFASQVIAWTKASAQGVLPTYDETVTTNFTYQ